MTVLSIDGGTTNTRLVLIQSGEILAAEKFGLGARNSVSDGAFSYAEHLTDAVTDFLGRQADVPEVALASGMICSEAGLGLSPYVPAPADADALAAEAVLLRLQSLPHLNLWLIPGMRTVRPTHDPADTDVMRGEETELLGICRQMGFRSPSVVLLPGSHLKTVFLTADGAVEDFRTSLSGELVRAAAENTILREKLYGVYPKTVDPMSLLRGYDCARECGVNEALFRVRIRQKFIPEEMPETLFAFLLGIVLSSDVEELKKRCGDRSIFVGGSDPFRGAYVRLLRERGGLPAEEIPESVSEYATAYGAERIAETMKVGETKWETKQN